MKLYESEIKIILFTNYEQKLERGKKTEVDVKSTKIPITKN